MLPPDTYDHLADDILELYGKLDRTILRDIVRRLVKAGRLTSTAQWQTWRGQESGLLYDAIIQAAAETSGQSDEAMRKVFDEAGQTAVAYDSRIYEAAGLSPPPLAFSPQASRVLEAGLTKTNGFLRNLTMTTALGAQQSFISAATLAEMQVESGAFDYATAIRNAVREAASGGQWVVYPTGHKDRLDVAVRRAVLTGVGQTAAQIGLAYAEDMDCDLVEVTAHAGARTGLGVANHAGWQGKVYSRSGQHPRYPDFVKSTGYGTGPGLCGWNCRHSFYPFFEGLSESAYPREEIAAMNSATVEYDGETIPLYAATQRQRAMERRIRDSKRELAGLDAGIKAAEDDGLQRALQEDFDAKSVTLKRQEAAYKDFVRRTGLQKDTSRVQVQGFGRSQAQKAVQAAKRDYEKFYAETGGAFLPPTLAQFQQMQYTNPKEWGLNTEAKKLFDKIEQTESYSAEYRQKLKQAYSFFRENGFAFREHALNRFLGQKNSKGKFHFTEDELLEILRKDCNYTQADGKNIRYYNGIAVVSAADTDEIVSIVVRGKPKADWRDTHDKK